MVVSGEETTPHSLACFIPIRPCPEVSLQSGDFNWSRWPTGSHVLSHNMGTGFPAVMIKCGEKSRMRMWEIVDLWAFDSTSKGGNGRREALLAGWDKLTHSSRISICKKSERRRRLPEAVIHLEALRRDAPPAPAMASTSIQAAALVCDIFISRNGGMTCNGLAESIPVRENWKCTGKIWRWAWALKNKSGREMGRPSSHVCSVPYIHKSVSLIQCQLFDIRQACRLSARHISIGFFALRSQEDSSSSSITLPSIFQASWICPQPNTYPSKHTRHHKKDIHNGTHCSCRPHVARRSRPRPRERLRRH